ncbi:metal-dependent transcriptional regulator [Thiofaba sp. EF100]|uniref:metal-dependent transcriptional regulator n=1 Tax=Thiofaba sp. EF100 TaxID=3121274 RepID=UPI00322172E6
MSSRALQDYLKAIYKLAGDTAEPVSTSALAERLKVAQPSVSGMVKKLAAEGLIEHIPYQGVRLTATGRRVAVETIRRHRIVEQFLVQVLGLSWDEVDAEAEVLEHSVSERVVNRMWEVLGRPASDPHGSPIPPPHEDLHELRVLCALVDAPLGLCLRVARLHERRPEELRYLGGLGLVPEALVWVEERAPFQGPLMIRVNGALHVLDAGLAAAILVEVNDQEEGAVEKA